MSMKCDRLRILIRRDQQERLERLAAARATWVAMLVREAIDLAYPAFNRRRIAADLILGASPMEVPDVDELRLELYDVRGGRPPSV